MAAEPLQRLLFLIGKIRTSLSSKSRVCECPSCRRRAMFMGRRRLADFANISSWSHTHEAAAN